ncbi:MAG: DUF5916 domain-containing protein [Chitinophagales bacterium]
MKKIVLIFSLFLVLNAFSQERTYHLYRTQELITVDGDLVEPIWARFPTAKDFRQKFPSDSVASSTLTEVKMCFDDRYLYISAVCYNNGDNKYVVNSLVRDFSFPKSDAFAIFLSPLKDKTNGLSFAVNPYNVQREGLVGNAGLFGVTTSWNQKWFSEVKRYENYWTVEMALPLNILKYKKDSDTWDLNFARNNLKDNETSVWSSVPQNLNVASINHYGKLVWKNELPKPKPNITFVPFLAAGAAYKYKNGKVDEIKNLSRLGLDTKIGITNTLNLDVTINPDFSNTEVDEQIINLDRFSLFFPERRLFFTENSDLFAGFGFSKIRPFFSRRIGLESNILGGLRLSGNITKGLRIGLMNIQTEGTNDSRQLDSQNFAVLALQQRVLGNSNVGLIVVNKQAFDGFKALKNQRNTVVGTDFNFRSKNNKWRGKVFYQQAFNKEKIGINNAAQAVWLNYVDKYWNIEYNHEYVGKAYDAEVGFVPRKGYFRFEHYIGRNFFAKKGKINRHNIGSYYSQYWIDGAVSTDRVNDIRYEMVLNNTSEIGAILRNNQTRLNRNFDLVGKGTPIEIGNYVYTSARLYYNSDVRKVFNFNLSLDYGQFYNGTKVTYTASADYNFRPRASIGLNFSRNELRFPFEYQDGFLTLIGTQFKVSFSTKVQWSTFLQYNTQANNFNINSRLQWRFAPMSDIFISYTDNYDTFLKQKNRALVLRFNYWFGI